MLRGSDRPDWRFGPAPKPCPWWMRNEKNEMRKLTDWMKTDFMTRMRRSPQRSSHLLHYSHLCGFLPDPVESERCLTRFGSFGDFLQVIRKVLIEEHKYWLHRDCTAIGHEAKICFVEFIVTRFCHYGVECRDDQHIIASAGSSNNISAGKNIKWPTS